MLFKRNSVLKNTLRSNSFLFKLNKIRRYFQGILFSKKKWYPQIWTFDVVESYANYKESVNFVQIGSNNGINNDPLYSFIKKGGWQGVLVEPVQHIFDELKKNYSKVESNIYFENSAITKESDGLKFYRIDSKGNHDIPEWFSGLGSFKKEVIQGHSWAYSDIDKLITEEVVNTMSFECLLRKYRISNLNLVHIDTEGYDFEILKSIPLKVMDIDVVMFEHIHLPQNDYKEAVKLLRKRGYVVGIKDSMDTIAIKKYALKLLTRKNTK